MSTSGFLRAPRAIRISVAIAIAAATGVTALVAPLDGRADATTSTCVPTANALGAATGWTEFVEGNGNRGAESEGAIAYGGNLPTAMTVGPYLPSGFDADDAALVVAGSHGQYFNLQRGSAYLTPQSGVNFNGGGHYLASNPIDFATAFTQLRALSDQWGAAAATGTVTAGVTGGNAALIFTGSSSSLNVFDLTTAQLADLAAGKHVGYDVPAGATTIINVPGTTPTIAGQAWIGSGSSWSQVNDGNIKGVYNGIVWNFPDATTLTLNYGSAWAGHILAPDAAVNVVGGGHNIGQVIAKSFSSNLETHFNLFPSQACVPGTPTPPGDSDVTITKSASAASPHGGDTVAYTLTATNVGASTATGVAIRDELPAGVTFVSATSPCTQLAGVVTCNVGSLAAGASTSVTITVLATPIAGAGPSSQPQAYHWMTPYHPEAQVDLEPGQQRSVSLSCNSGDILSDGDFRVDHVDQGTGTFSDVKILSSRIDGLGLGTWKGVIRNDATGRVQAKAFIACLPGRTEAADRQTGYGDSHRHDLLADTAALTATVALPVGRTSTTLTCPSGAVPIAPGYDLSSASAVLVGSETDDDHRTWTFTFDATSPVTATVSARCLHTTTSSVYGHTHELRFTHVVTTVSVPGDTAAEGNEFKVICPDDAKGVTATFLLPPGVQHWGNDPRMKERAFRLFNQTGSAKSATIDLVCLHDRTTTERMGTEDPVTVVNTATVTSTSTDANSTNNSASASISVQPGSSTTGLVGSGRATASAFSVRVASSMPGTGALTARSNGTVLAQGSVTLRPGRSTTATLRLTAAGKRRLGSLDRVTVEVDPTRGRTTTRTVRVVR
ncbi:MULTISPECIES: choice-of-anchor A family protein [unclassified Nocardioides]|uniref:choice-of-anchor A family protein n=1 Tax=unclassified Nocardioides TaxID=2615069 RepID=UPI000A2710AA|nr:MULTISPECIES: choice-of-anchor A family protein [unclassified Nocardioides]